jgi:glycosyltransferase involved in cell wall biosynthesis
MKKKQFIMIIVLCTLCYFSKENAKETKVVALIQIRNEEAIIEQCLKALSLYVDSIIVLDDASTDNTMNIVTLLQKRLPIEHILTQTESAWQKSSEYDNRTKLLNVGRACGGTHFVMLDADEMFSACCLKKNWLRNKIISLKPGQALSFPTIEVWDGIEYFRNDNLYNPYIKRFRTEAVFCDDERCNYDDSIFGCSKVVHISRFPFNLKCENGNYQMEELTDLNYGLLHFKCANVENLKIKRLWYMFLDYIALTKKNKANAHSNGKKVLDWYTTYPKVPHSKEIVLTKTNPEWFAYDFFKQEACMSEQKLKKDELLKWLRQYGKNFFEPLHLSQEDWALLTRHNAVLD